MANHNLKDSISIVLKKIFLKKGEIFAEIIMNWEKILGNEFAESVYPVDIKYYTSNNNKISCLVLKMTEKGNALTLQFSALIIIERINRYLGYNAITKIKFI